MIESCQCQCLARTTGKIITSKVHVSVLLHNVEETVARSDSWEQGRNGKKERKLGCGKKWVAGIKEGT